MVVAHPPSKIIRVLVADDHPVVRDGLAAVLNTKPCIDVVAQVSNGREVVEQFRQHQPDV
ncbi:response regulator transcription factor, partial [Oscillatoria sp. FACHB-1407]|uniref:response regulator transcription factor n=1 Tax=Oscillatoria sp. FACHB-1407 TaxID=2692847 RepID=UPI0030DCC12F